MSISSKNQRFRILSDETWFKINSEIKSQFHISL